MLTIRSTKVLRGPSIWSPVPVILLDVEIGGLEARLSNDTPIFFERLIELVPSLSDYDGVVTQLGGGLRRLLLDRLAIALQNLARAGVARDHMRFAGPKVTYADTHPTDERGAYTVVYEYEHDEVGLAAGLLAVRLLNHLIAKREANFDFTRELEVTVISLAKRHAYPWVTGAFVAAAQRRGIPRPAPAGKNRHCAARHWRLSAAHFGVAHLRDRIARRHVRERQGAH